MLNLYQEILMDHFRNPRNHKKLIECDFCSEQRNRSCGDEVVFMGLIKNGLLTEVAFQGKGCVISQATASLLSEKVKNMPLDDIRALDKDDLIAMLGIPLGPVRLLCGLLSLTALHNGISEYKNRNS
jgi:nitrogen fixation NifU-like protein